MRVVQRLREKPVITLESAPGTVAQRVEPVPQLREHGLLADSLVRIGQRGSVHPVELVARPGHELQKLGAPLLDALPLDPRLIGALRLDPAPHPFALNRGRERLVECGVVADVHDLVGQLVEDQSGQLRLGQVDESIEQRIGEPAEGRVGLNRADADVVSVRGQFGRKPLGL